MKVLVAQIDILETMTPSSFSSFRDRLETASGFQSVQFREVEFALGYKRASTVNYLKPDYPGYDRLNQRLHERTVVDHFYDFLQKRGAQIPPELKNRDVMQPNGPDERVQQEILRLYKNSPECSILFELMTDFDGTIASQLGQSEGAADFSVFMFAQTGELLAQWHSVPSADELAAVIKKSH